MSILLLCIFVFIIIYIFKKNTYKMYKVKSTINNKYYLILKTKEKSNDIHKANILANVDIKISKLINSLSSSESKSLLQDATINLQERDTKENVGYTINKGDVIGLCIEDDINTLFFIVIHELAHIITKQYGHPPKFWENFKFLIEKSNEIGIYNYQNYNQTPVNYCKKEINYSPLKK